LKSIVKIMPSGAHQGSWAFNAAFVSFKVILSS
jgi:hypothetical protein